jgi:hypothetical protein
MTRPDRPPGRQDVDGPQVIPRGHHRRDTQPAEAKVTLASVAARTCQAPGCDRLLPGRRRRFCCDLCRVRGQRAERVIGTSDYGSGLVRQITRMGTRASGDLDALEWLAGAVDHARTALAVAVDGCRARGFSDAEIGAALGITRQAVGQRFGRKRALYTGTGGQ